MRGRRQRQLLLRVDDDARFEQYRRHLCLAQDDEIVKSINSPGAVQRYERSSRRTVFRIVTPRLQAARHQLTCQRPGEIYAASIVAVFTGHKKRKAGKVV